MRDSVLAPPLRRWAFVLILSLSSGSIAAQRGRGTQAVNVTPSVVPAIAGDYDARTATITVSTQDDGTLTLLMPPQPLYVLQPQQPGVLYAIRGKPGVSVEFVRNWRGTVTHLQVVQPLQQHTFVAVRKTLQQAIPEASAAASTPPVSTPAAAPARTPPPVPSPMPAPAATTAVRGATPSSPTTNTPGTSADSGLIDYDAFARTWAIRDIYEDQLRFVNREFDRVLLVSYMTGADSFIQLTPNKYDATCRTIADAGFSEALRALTKKWFFGYLDKQNVLDRQSLMLGLTADTRAAEKDGRDDALVLAADYGGCSGPVMRRFYENMKTYVRNPPASRK